MMILRVKFRKSLGDVLRLSPTSDPYGHPNPKWVARDPKSVSNRIPIQVTYFGLSERHNLNMSILSPENPFVERIIFCVLLSENIPNGY